MNYNIEAFSKKGFLIKFRVDSNFNPQVPAGSALGVHTEVFRGDGIAISHNR
mgnify:CR=1 FL=1